MVTALRRIGFLRHLEPQHDRHKLVLANCMCTGRSLIGRCWKGGALHNPVGHLPTFRKGRWLGHRHWGRRPHSHDLTCCNRQSLRAVSVRCLPSICKPVRPLGVLRRSEEERIELFLMPFCELQAMTLSCPTWRWIATSSGVTIGKFPCQSLECSELRDHERAASC